MAGRGYLNPKISTEMAGSIHLAEITRKIFEVIQDDIQSLSRFEILQLLGSIDRIFINKADDLLELERKTRELMTRIRIAESYFELRDIHADLNETQHAFFGALPSVTDLHGTCTEYRDALSKKVIELVSRELISQNIYLPDESFAYLSMGSDGRMEQTLLTDQDNLILYEDSPGRYAGFFYEKFAKLLVDRLELCGFKKCTGDIMPSNPLWRGNSAKLLDRVDHICSFTNADFKKNMVNLIVLSDLRFVYGNEELARHLIDRVYQKMFGNNTVINEIAKSAATTTLAKGFMNSLKTEKKGRRKGLLNIKLHCWAPLILVVRAFAIKYRITETNTLKRIDELQKKGAFGSSEAQQLRDAYYTITRLRILAQLLYLDGRNDSDIYLNPGVLTDSAKTGLVDALKCIDRLQKLLVESMGLRI